MKVPAVDLGAAHAELASELEQAALRVLRSGHYLRGSEGEEFEAEFAEYCGVGAAVGVANGLEALQLTLEAMGIGAGDEVVVSSHTSVATWLAISHAGARPVPVEPEPDSMLIDPTRVEAAIGERTAAIVAVHLYGMPADMDALATIARKHHIALLEDASQAHGARLRGRPVGSLSDVAAFSLYPTKNLGAAGDAGIAVSNDSSLLERVRLLANHSQRQGHHSELRGHNSRLDELQAALLRVKLVRLDDWNARRRLRAGQYLDALSDCPGIALPAVTAGSTPVWHQFVVRLPARDTVRKDLAAQGVETLVHYPVAPHQIAGYTCDCPDPLPITEQLAESVLSLPMSPQLTEPDCERVCEALCASTAVLG